MAAAAHRPAAEKNSREAAAVTAHGMAAGSAPRGR
jgi:hypothetical protein